MTVRLVFIMISIIVSLSWANSGYAHLSPQHIQELKEKANNGNPHAQLKLGNEALINSDYHQAYKWYKKLSKQPSSSYKRKGLLSLGMLYVNGEGDFPKDYKTAKSYLQKATDANYTKPYTGLGLIYYNGGHGIKQDRAKAKHYYQLAAQNGNAPAMFNIGNLYAHKNQYKKAFHWYHQAAKQYYLSGMYVVGILYAIGKQGVRQNKVEGCKWFRLALKVYPDYQKAHYMLGKLIPTMDYTQKYACHQAVKKYLKHHDVPRKSDFKARLELKS